MTKQGNTPEAGQRELIDSTPFSVSARVAMQLGRESISSSVTAILELVKNAYDADADVVRIRFGNLGTSSAKMLIEDDGKGMSPDELRSHWMVIGTANKAKVQKSRVKKRVLTGEKGLGRLGLDRLCGRTRVQSVTAGASSAVELDVEWDKYEGVVARLEDVVHPIFRIPDLRHDPLTDQYRNYPKGTRLILENLKDKWDEYALEELRSELSLLISPFHAQNDFRVELEIGGGLSRFDGPVSPDSAILKNAYWKVVGTLDAEGRGHILMSSLLHEEKFEQSSNSWEDLVKGQGEKPKCGPLRFEFYFFHRGELESAPQSLSLPKLNQFLKSNQGVRIYRDGFRVKPYGEPNGEGDWLRLAFRRTIHPEGVRQSGSWKLGYNQVVGAVFISREDNRELVDQTNREGLVLGDAFSHLRIFAEKVLVFFERSHQRFERERIELAPKLPSQPERAKASSEAAGAALKELGQLKQQLEDWLSPARAGAGAPSVGAEAFGQNFERPIQTLTKTLKELEESVEQENARRIQSEKEKNTLANLASLGILAACFGHETCGWANTVQANSSWLYRNLRDNLILVPPALKDLALQALEDLGTDSKKLQTFAAFALGNVRPDKRRRRSFCVKKVALDVIAAFRETLQIQKTIYTEIGNMPSHDCIIKAYRIDWESIFANLLTNAMWAITKNCKERRILIEIDEDASNYIINFCDSGFGLEAGTEEHVFEAGFSTKRNTKGEQEGTGMGLYIVREFVVENSGGTIRATAKGKLGGAGFVLTVPKANPVLDGEA